MTYIDPHGSRLAVGLMSPVRLASDLSWVSLTGSTSDSALIRASATGGASIHTLAGEARPSFNHFCSTHTDVIQQLSHRLTDCVSGSPGRGYSILIPVPANRLPRRSRKVLARAMRTVYVKGAEKAEARVHVGFESQEVKEAWEALLDFGLEDYLGRPPSQADQASLRNMPASTRTIGLFASRAVLTDMILDEVERTMASGGAFGGVDRILPLTSKHLEQAKRYADFLFSVSSGVRQLEARAANAATARESWLSMEKLLKAGDELENALKQAPDGRLSRSAIHRNLNVTLSQLDALEAAGDRFVEVQGTHAGRTSRFYILKSSATMDSEEALAELEEATEEFERDPETFPEHAAAKVFHELQDLAMKANTEILLPAVPITRMTPKQIAAIPRLLLSHASEVCLRGTGEYPEPSHLTEGDEEDEAPLELGVPSLWFRARADGSQFRDWDVASKLGFGERWGSGETPAIYRNEEAVVKGTYMEEVGA